MGIELTTDLLATKVQYSVDIVMYKWKYHVPTNQHSKVKDLVKANRDCVANGLHTSSQFYDFRKTSSSMTKTYVGSKDIPVYLPEDDFTYGKPGEYIYFNSVFKIRLTSCLGMDMEMTTLCAGAHSIERRLHRLTVDGESYRVISQNLTYSSKK
jgi:hypothetical protein